ncbi:MAG: MFS transporter [Erysipelotrichaceae bacterium]|nr:MFS transporter [Erysipelotrichaceae bacterium]
MRRNSLIYLYVIFASCLLACATIGIPNTYGLFYQPLADALNTGKGNATLHVSIAGLVTGFSSPLIVRTLKKVSYRTIMILGLSMFLLSGYFIASAKNLFIVDLMGIFRGLGLACTTNVIITMITGNWFESARGTISGLIMSFTGIMGALFSPVLSSILETRSFHDAYLICIFLMILLSVPALFIPFRPQDIGMEPYHSSSVKEKTKDSYEGFYPLSFRNPTFYLLVFTSFLVICVTTLTSYLPSYAESLGQSAKAAASLLSASMIGNVLFKFLIGICIDRYGVIFSFRLFMFVSMIGLACIILFAKSSYILFVAGIIYGACYAVNKVAVPLTVRIFYGDEKYGEAYSMLTMFENIARSSIITAIGFIYDFSGTYLYFFLFSLIAGICSALLISVHEKKIRQE